MSTKRETGRICKCGEPNCFKDGRAGHYVPSQSKCMPGPLSLKEITDGTPDCTCRFVPGKLNLQRCPLHAAAPELLAACKRTLGYLNPRASAGESELVEQVRAAIAKATTEEKTPWCKGCPTASGFANCEDTSCPDHPGTEGL